MAPKGTVHVIDDDQAMRESGEFLLDSAGYEVRIYESAHAFLEAMPDAVAGCIISDVRMPGIDGLDLLKRLKAAKSKLPVLIMTGHDNPRNQAELLRAGANDLVQKPIEERLLITKLLFQMRVAKHLRERARAA